MRKAKIEFPYSPGDTLWAVIGDQVARCGNAVCPQMASAVVRANLPEWAVEMHTMEDMERMISI